MKVVFVDVDGVVANLIDPWLEKYNKMYEDTLKKEDIKDWNIHNFVKPSCGERIYKFIGNSQIYNFVKPIGDSLEKIKLLKLMGFRIVYATAITGQTRGRKLEWLKDYGYLDNDKDYIEINDKSLLRGEFLIDDNIDNVRNFFGHGILFRQPWNEKYKFYNDAKDWHGVLYRMNLLRYEDSSRFP